MGSAVTPVIVCPHLKPLRDQGLRQCFIAARVLTQAVNHVDTSTLGLLCVTPSVGRQSCAVCGGEIAQRGGQRLAHGMRATTSATEAVKRRA